MVIKVNYRVKYVEYILDNIDVDQKLFSSKIKDEYAHVFQNMLHWQCQLGYVLILAIFSFWSFFHYSWNKF